MNGDLRCDGNLFMMFKFKRTHSWRNSLINVSNNISRSGHLFMILCSSKRRRAIKIFWDKQPCNTGRKSIDALGWKGNENIQAKSFLPSFTGFQAMDFQWMIMLTSSPYVLRHMGLYVKGNRGWKVWWMQRVKCQGYLPFYWLEHLHSLETCCSALLSPGKVEHRGNEVGFWEVSVMRWTRVRSLQEIICIWRLRTLILFLWFSFGFFVFFFYGLVWDIHLILIY